MIFTKIKCFVAFGIFEDSLVHFAGKTLVGVNNWADEGFSQKKYFWQESKKYVAKPYPSDVIVLRARQFLKDQDIGSYHLFKNNCEIFATQCRYGKPLSGQSIGFGWGLGGWFQT